MARAYPAVAPLRELRGALSEMRLSDLAVGRDGRNRTLLSAFRARTGRNQPSNTKFIFGPSVWLRGLIQPPPGHGLAYIDWAQQEFGIAAALSGDPLMMDAYRSGDPYLAFAKQAGAAPAEATKATHKAVRDQFKACVLAVQYGMGADALALRIGQPPIRARELLRLHRETYRVFWRWSDAAVDHAMLTGELHTVFGWRVQVPAQCERPFLAQLSDAGERRRDAAAGLLPRHRTRHRGLRAGPRRGADLRAARSAGRRRGANAGRSCARRRASCSTGSSSAPTRPWCGTPTATWTNAAPSCGSG